MRAGLRGWSTVDQITAERAVVEGEAARDLRRVVERSTDKLTEDAALVRDVVVDVGEELEARRVALRFRVVEEAGRRARSYAKPARRAVNRKAEILEHAPN